MDPTHIHLIFNHVPVLGSVVALALLAFGILKKNDSLTNAGLAAAVVSALGAIPVFLTGDEAEDAVEHLPGVVRSMIHEHEHAADFAFWGIILLGILALVTLWLRRKNHSLSKLFTTISCLLSLFVFTMMAKTSFEGGKIRHTEVRATSEASQNVEQPAGGQDKDKDED